MKIQSVIDWIWLVYSSPEDEWLRKTASNLLLNNQEELFDKFPTIE